MHANRPFMRRRRRRTKTADKTRRSSYIGKSENRGNGIKFDCSARGRVNESDEVVPGQARPGPTISIQLRSLLHSINKCWAVGREISLVNPSESFLPVVARRSAISPWSRQGRKCCSICWKSRSIIKFQSRIDRGNLRNN